jgi:hypothetical protein
MSFFVIVSNIILSFNFFIRNILRNILPSYNYKHGDKSQACIPTLDSKTGIKQPVLIFGWYYKN